VTGDLAAFLAARLNEDEEWARNVLAEPAMANDHGIARRWLREVAAKRWQDG